MSRLEIGAKAPPFALANQAGKTISMKDFAGERFVIYFYPADDTPGCTKEACQFNDGLAAFRKLGVKVLGVSPDGAVKHVAFRKKYGLTFDLLSDPEKKVMTSYGAYGEKMMYGKKVNGVIRSTFVIGPTGKIERAWYGVRADGHADKVLATLSS
jgi:peroxiredoxin Q/BCP